MTRSTTSDDGLDDLIGAAADDFLRRLERGEQPDPKEYAARHPEIADVLRGVLSLIHLVPSPAPLPALPPVSVFQTPGVLGDFRIIREVGRGGMGVVYEAEQISLSRRVALKVLPFAATLDPRHLTRFRNEARAAASLHHPHIVPVYGVGEVRGVHFYAMQFVDGRPLSDLIDAVHPDRPSGTMTRTAPLPSDHESPAAAADTRPNDALCTLPVGRGPAFFRRVADLGIEAAEALEHAHSLGVVHRDVKPGNLLIDVRGQLWVSDFGLAKMTTDVGVTQTGDVLGTLRYMSPEQALVRHDLVDHRTDIYALGATLYELISGRPAVDGKDRAEIVRSIGLVDPIAPRRLDGRVPRDLETVVLKCLRKEPNDRYQSAKELSDDLSRFQRSEPVRAKPVGLVLRARRWCQRNPRAAVVGIILAALVCGLASTSVMFWRQRVRAEEARAAEIRHRDEARRAVDTMYTDVAEKVLFKLPQSEPVHREFLLKAVAYYEEFAREEGADRNVRFKAAQANGRVGMIYLFLEERGKALGPMGRAVTLAEQLVAEEPGSPEYRFLLAITNFQLSFVLNETGRPAEALTSRQRSVSLMERLAAENPTLLEYQQAFAHCSSRLGFLLKESGRYREAEDSHRRAVAIADEGIRRFPTNSEMQIERARALWDLGLLFVERDRPGEAEDVLTQGMTVWTQLEQTNPSLEVRECMGYNVFYLGSAQVKAGHQQEARSSYARAIAGFRRMAAEYPEQPRYARFVVRSSHRLAELATAPADSSWLSDAATALMVGPANDLTYSLLAARLLNRAATLTELDSRLTPAERRARSCDYEERARELLAVIDARSPPLAHQKNQLAWAIVTWPFPDRDRVRRAVALADEAVGLERHQRAYWTTLGVARYRNGEWAAAIEALATASRLNSSNDSFEPFFLAMAHWRLGENEQARSWYAKGLEPQQTVMAWSEELARFRAEAAELLGISDKK